MRYEYPENAMIDRIAYYVPTIPNVWSTDEYQHSISLIENSKTSIIISNNEIPEDIGRMATNTHVIKSDSVLRRAYIALDIVQDKLDDGVYVTSYPYESALSGLLAHKDGIEWVPDIFETPAQYRLNNPKTYHQFTSRGLEIILDQSVDAVHSFHPDTPYQYGKNKKFLTNGSPVSKIQPKYPMEDNLSVVWVGSPRLDRGGEILIDALANINFELSVDIYGEIDNQLTQYARREGVHKYINSHGWVSNQKALNAIQHASVGYAVLPPRTDWKYAPAIKIGEYLAGGTIPLISDFPGSRYVADQAGVYVQPSGKMVSAKLRKLHQESKDRRKKRMLQARRRGEKIAWNKIRAKFARYISESHSNE